MEISDEIKNIIRGDVDSSDQARQKYSRDYSLFQVRPEVVVYPQDAEDVKALVKFASQREGVSLTPRSAGTDMTGGPLNESIILDFTRYFNKIQEVGSGYAVTQPGVYYRDFEKATLANGWLLPSYPASRDLCTVGGMAANNSSGEKSLVYGDTGDYIEEINAVLSDGNEYSLKALSAGELEAKMTQNDFEGDIYRRLYRLIDGNYELIRSAKPKVSKNSAGYFLWDVWDKKRFDLTKLFAGSQGTLGIITQIKFRLIKPLQRSSLLVIYLRDFKTLPEIVRKVLEQKPESFESYDDNTLKLAIRFLPAIASGMGAGNAMSLGFKLIPDFWLMLTLGFPKLVLMAEFASDSQSEAAVRAQAARESIKSLPVRSRIAGDREDANKYWTIRRESFNLLRSHSGGRRTAPFIDDIIVRPDQLSLFLPRLKEILDQYGLRYTIAGHIGDANFHIIPLIKAGDAKIREIIPELSDKVYDLIFSFHGSTTGEHNDGLIRSPYLEKMYGPEVYRLFEEVKAIFDHRGIFNPGKKVGASIEYAMSHLVV